MSTRRLLALIGGIGFILLGMVAARPDLRYSIILPPEDRLYPELPFRKIHIERSMPVHVWGKGVGDLDGDGDPDLIAGGWEAGGLVWYANPTWKKSRIADGQLFATDLEVCDVDRDRDQDVVSVRGNGITWYENPGWTPHQIAVDTVHDAEVVDLDGDGDCDVAARGQTEFNGSGSRLLLFEQVAPTRWLRRVVSIPEGEGLRAADIDRDGDVDLVINQSWLENTPSGDWPRHLIASAWTHDDAYVEVADVDGDGDLDVLHSPSGLRGERYRLSWFEAPPDPRTGPWTEHVIADQVEAVLHSLNAADFDGDGDIDVATAEMTQGADPDEVRILLNVGGTGKAWRSRLIGLGGSHDMRAFDVDGDGDVDLFGGNWNGVGVHLFRNEFVRMRGSAHPTSR